MGLFGRREQRVCWVRSATENPCGMPATLEVLGVPFCESCAREHEEYAAIGALTDPLAEEELGRLREDSLAASLRKLRRESASHAVPRGSVPEPEGPTRLGPPPPLTSRTGR